MNTLELIDTRIRRQLERINRTRERADKDEIRIDMDTPLRGYLQLNEEWQYKFRTDLTFQPMLELDVTCRQNVYYFDFRPMAYDSEIYKALKYPPERDRKRNETFWLANELDVAMEAIEKHLVTVLA